MKPFIVCHMMASLDGRIDCDLLEQLGENESYDETLKHYKDMQTFVDNSRSQKPTGTLANDPTIPVYSPDAYLLWGKTMNMLKLVGN